jgi:hypothetical protein
LNAELFHRGSYLSSPGQNGAKIRAVCNGSSSRSAKAWRIQTEDSTIFPPTQAGSLGFQPVFRAQGWRFRLEPLGSNPTALRLRAKAPFSTVFRFRGLWLAIAESNQNTSKRV